MKISSNNIIAMPKIHYHLALGLLLSYSTTYSQILPLPQITVIGSNPMAAAQHLAGPGVTIHSASFSGDVDQCALFTNGEEAIGFEDGVSLTTGNASLAGQHAVSCAGCDTESEVDANNAGPDPDIAQLTNFSQKSTATLEFTFSTVNDQIEFEFVFASLEYPSFVNSVYNDRFLLCMSGPGISGPFTNGAINIATLPNGDFVSINTVNGGNIFEPASNPEYFKANYPLINPITHYWRYNGQTVPIKIVRNIQCNKIYTLKLVIANIKDNKRDSGVFFKKGSLKADFNLGDLTAAPAPVCEGQPINLNIIGDNGYTYNWSTGEQGVNLKNINPASNSGITNYSVVATAPNGCVIGTRSVDITVHPNYNQPPYMNGINNTGVYKAYVRAGENISFQIPTFDNPVEEVDFIPLINITGLNHNEIPTFHQIGTFSWTPNQDQIGEHTFQAYARDQNVCHNLQSETYTFTIVVICPYCEVGIDYNNRNPSNNPVPLLTEMAEYITAGLQGPVVLGAPTIFRAGEYILLDEFEPGDEFLAEIVPVCDEEACNQCCEVLDGLFVPPFIPSVFSPNGDGFNDLWYVADLARPFCSFNAQYYDLEIFTRWGGESIYHVTVTSAYCCPFKSPPTPTSVSQSIFWNGKHANGNDADDGTYYYVLKLAGCGNAPDPLTGYLLLASSSSGRYADTADVETPASPTGEAREKTSNAGKLVGYPNPVKDIFTLEWLKDQPDDIETSYFIYDLTGRLIAGGQFTGAGTHVNTAGLAIGIYNCIVICEDHLLNALKIVKQ